MKFWEAMKALDEGKNVRCKTWKPDCFLLKFTTGEIGWSNPSHGSGFTSFMDEEWELHWQ